MKAIIIKINDKVVGVSQITDLTSKKYVELEQEAKKTFELKDKQVKELQNEVSYLKDYANELNAKLNYLGKQIAIDRGEIEPDSDEEYEIVVKETPIEEESEIEHPTLEEDAEVVETEPQEPTEENE